MYSPKEFLFDRFSFLNRERTPRSDIRVNFRRQIEHEDFFNEKTGKLQKSDLWYILTWMTDPHVHEHLSPKLMEELGMPLNLRNNEQVKRAIQRLSLYYRNNDEEPVGRITKIMPIVATNDIGIPVGVITLRRKGDPYIPKSSGAAGIESLIVDPKLQHRGIGTALVEEGEKIIFEEWKRPEARLWVMADERSGNYHDNLTFFTKKLRYSIIGSDYIDYCERTAQDHKNRNAFWLKKSRDTWEKTQTRKSAKLLAEGQAESIDNQSVA